jgi:Family of unknown function (DUF6768)
MKSHDEIDALIHEALSEEEAAFHDRLGEASMYDTVTAIFTGRHRWLTWLGMAVTVIFVVLAVVSAMRYFQTEDLAQRITWAGAVLLACAVVLATKIWAWMELQRNMLTREIKRLELQVAHLAAELRSRG